MTTPTTQLVTVLLDPSHPLKIQAPVSPWWDSSLFAGLLGTVVGATITVLTTTVLCSVERTRERREQLYAELLPTVMPLGELALSECQSRFDAIYRLSRVSGRVERRQEQFLEDARKRYQRGLEAIGKANRERNALSSQQGADIEPYVKAANKATAELDAATSDLITVMLGYSDRLEARLTSRKARWWPQSGVRPSRQVV